MTGKKESLYVLKDSIIETGLWYNICMVGNFIIQQLWHPR